MILWGHIETQVHDMNESRDVPCKVFNIHMEEPYTLVGSIENYSGHVWFNPESGQWMRALSALPREEN